MSRIRNGGCRAHHIAGLLLLLLLLGACGPTRELAQRALPDSPAPERLSAMQYFRWLGEASSEHLAEELERLEREWPRASVVDKAQLALLLSVSPLADDYNLLRARDILYSMTEEVVITQRSQDYLALAELWGAVLQLRDNLSGATLARDDARQELDASRRDIEALQARLVAAEEAKVASEHRVGELEEQIKALKKQIEALTTIEQQLIEREQSQAQP